jgi:hypothetical protein
MVDVVDKLGVINRALGLTGNNFVNVAEDGSDEWNVASIAYEDALADMMEDHSWSFATLVAMLTPAVNAPSDDQFDTAYNFPADFLHLLWVRLNDMPTVYDILNRQLVINAQGGPPPPSPPNVPGVVTIKYVSANGADPVLATPKFVRAITAYVMSGIYRGLHEDPGQADNMWKAADAFLQRARTRHDQQKPKRAMFNSRIAASRRIRRPWPPTPTGWSGSGIPG